MFLASLEMNLQDVQRIKGRAAALGLLGFIIPMVLGYVANTALLGFGAAAAILMAAMYASHTLVAYPIVLRYGLSRLTSVSIAVGGTIVADTLTLLVLAVVGGMMKENVTGLYWVWLVVKVILLGLLIIYAFPRLGRWFFVVTMTASCSTSLCSPSYSSAPASWNLSVWKAFSEPFS